MNGKNALADRLRQGREALARITARLRRREMVMALLVLAIPSLAIAQPLGLLLWARMRILTSIPRTAMAVEEGLRSFLQEERGFSERRMERAINRLSKAGRLRSASQPTLFDF